MIVGIAMVKTVYDRYPEKFEWRQNAYEYVFDKNPFDVICGTDKIRKAVEAGESLEKIEEDWQNKLSEFKHDRGEYLLY